MNDKKKGCLIGLIVTTISGSCLALAVVSFAFFPTFVSLGCMLLAIWVPYPIMMLLKKRLYRETSTEEKGWHQLLTMIASSRLLKRKNIYLNGLLCFLLCVGMGLLYMMSSPTEYLRDSLVMMFVLCVVPTLLCVGALFLLKKTAEKSREKRGREKGSEKKRGQAESAD